MNHQEPSGLDGQSSAVEQDLGGHPLFPRPATETGPDTRQIDLIQLVRILPDKTREVCPIYWKASELRSWQQVYEAYGGGTYVANAQSATTNRYTARSETMYFAGLSKPFVPEPQAPPGSPMPHQQAALPPP